MTGFKELVVAEPLVNLKLASITVNDSPGSAQSIIEAQESEGSDDEWDSVLFPLERRGLLDFAMR